jgi:hypothetical protein
MDGAHALLPKCEFATTIWSFTRSRTMPSGLHSAVLGPEIWRDGAVLPDAKRGKTSRLPDEAVPKNPFATMNSPRARSSASPCGWLNVVRAPWRVRIGATLPEAVRAKTVIDPPLAVL